MITVKYDSHLHGRLSSELQVLGSTCTEGIEQPVVCSQLDVKIYTVFVKFQGAWFIVHSNYFF